MSACSPSDILSLCYSLYGLIVETSDLSRQRRQTPSFAGFLLVVVVVVVVDSFVVYVSLLSSSLHCTLMSHPAFRVSPSSCRSFCVVKYLSRPVLK